ncbi:MAG TPA: hypothetical protein VGB77_06570 [Abditibacteriaceae bacterium]|jgi:hypothetical protein
MSKKQVEMQPYRMANAADPASPPSDAEVANNVLQTKHYDGITLNVQYANGVGAAGFELEVLFFDRQNSVPPTEENPGVPVFFEDKAQKITEDAAGNFTYEIKTAGREVYIRVASLLGDDPQIIIQQGAFLASKV